MALGLSPSHYYSALTSHEPGLWVGCGFLAVIGFGLLMEIDKLDGQLEPNEESQAYCSDKHGNLLSAFVHLCGPPGSVKTTMARATIRIMLGASLPGMKVPLTSLAGSKGVGVGQVADLVTETLPDVLYLRNQLQGNLSGEELGRILHQYQSRGTATPVPDDDQLDTLAAEAGAVAEVHPVRTQRINYAFVADEIQCLAEGRTHSRLPVLHHSLGNLFGHGVAQPSDLRTALPPVKLHGTVGLSISNPKALSFLHPSKACKQMAAAMNEVLDNWKEEERVSEASLALLSSEMRQTLSSGQLLDRVADWIFNLDPLANANSDLTLAQRNRLKSALLEQVVGHASSDVRRAFVQDIFRVREANGLLRRTLVQPLVIFLTTARDSVSCGLSYYLRIMSRHWRDVDKLGLDPRVLAAELLESPDMHDVFDDGVDTRSQMSPIREYFGALGAADGRLLNSVATVKSSPDASSLEPELLLSSLRQSRIVGRLNLKKSFHGTTDLMRGIGNVDRERPLQALSLGAWLGPLLRAAFPQRMSSRHQDKATRASRRKERAADRAGGHSPTASVDSRPPSLDGPTLGPLCKCCENDREYRGMYGLCRSCAGHTGKKDASAIVYIACYQGHSIASKFEQQGIKLSELRKLSPQALDILKIEMKAVVRAFVGPHLNRPDRYPRNSIYDKPCAEIDELRSYLAGGGLSIDKARQKYASLNHGFLWLRLLGRWLEMYPEAANGIFAKVERALSLS